MNFHPSLGEDYYSQNRDPRVNMNLIRNAINSFDWDNLDIKKEEVKEQLANKINDELSHAP